MNPVLGKSLVVYFNKPYTALTRSAAPQLVSAPA
jgi:hypothetical protein